MNTFKTPKGTDLPVMDLKGKPYLQVQHRVRWFREEFPNWGIETDVKIIGQNVAMATATIKDESGRTRAMSHKVESEANFADYVEKAESGAIGRALALCGFGTQFAADLDEGERVVDSPLMRQSAPFSGNPAEFPCPAGRDKGKPIGSLPRPSNEASLKYWIERGKREQLSPTITAYIEALRSVLDSTPDANTQDDFKL